MKGFQYNSLKASLILKGLNAMNSIGELSSIDANAAQAETTELISLIENEEDVDADYLSSLLETYKDELELLKAKFHLYMISMKWMRRYKSYVHQRRLLPTRG